MLRCPLLYSKCGGLASLSQEILTGLEWNACVQDLIILQVISAKLAWSTYFIQASNSKMDFALPYVEEATPWLCLTCGEAFWELEKMRDG